MGNDQRVIVMDGTRYAARVRGAAPWNRARLRWWQFWRRRSDLVDGLAADVIEFTGHPTPLRSRVESAIPQGTLHTIPEKDLIRKLRRALMLATHPAGNDLVALTRGDQRVVMTWADWNVLGALLLAGGYELQGGYGAPEVPERDAMALHHLISELKSRHEGPASRVLPQDLPEGLLEFLAGGAFHLNDIG